MRCFGRTWLRPLLLLPLLVFLNVTALWIAPAVCRAADPAPTASPAFSTRDYTFESGAVRLVGRLFEPRVEGRSPLVVLVQGSDYDDANSSVYWRLIANTLAKSGIASFSFNKRGIAGSGGQQTDNFEIQASDVSAACRFASALPEVAPGKVGMYGISQAGWIVPRAIKDCQVAFVILVSPAGITPAEQVDYYFERQFAAVGLTGEEASQALELHRAIAQYYRTGSGFERAQSLVDRAVVSAWYAKYDKVDYRAEIPETHRLPSPAELALVQADYAFYHDPLTWTADEVVYESLRQPILFLYGGKDENVPVARSIAIFQSAMSAVENPDVTIHIFEDADHSIQIGPRLLPGYREYLTAWILGHL